MTSARYLVAMVLAVCLAACSGGNDSESALSSAERTRAQALLKSYEAARAAENWEAAEATADRLRGKYPDSPEAGALQRGLEQVRAQAAIARETRRLHGLWEYQRVAAGAGTQRTAAIYSRTAPGEEGETAATPDARLVLRDHPSWGRSAYLLLTQSKFDCGRPCALAIRFDDTPAQPFAGKQADSGVGPALFIVDEKRFVEALGHAKKIRIALPKGSGFAPSLMFEVDGFEPTAL
jgi:hypothetical protein